MIICSDTFLGAENIHYLCLPSDKLLKLNSRISSASYPVKLLFREGDTEVMNNLIIYPPELPGSITSGAGKSTDCGAGSGDHWKVITPLPDGRIVSRDRVNCNRSCIIVGPIVDNYIQGLRSMGRGTYSLLEQWEA